MSIVCMHVCVCGGAWGACLRVCDRVYICGFEFDWRFYALSVSKAIFRTRTYSNITYLIR